MLDQITAHMYAIRLLHLLRYTVKMGPAKTFLEETTRASFGLFEDFGDEGMY